MFGLAPTIFITRNLRKDIDFGILFSEARHLTSAFYCLLERKQAK